MKALYRSIVVGLMLVSVSIGLAQEPEQPLAREDAYEQLRTRLDALELRNPKEHSACFEIRLLIERLFQENPGLRIDAVGYNPEVGRDLYSGCQDLSDEALARELRRITGTHAPIGYQTAQDVIFAKLHNVAGKVECVYTGKVIETVGEPSATIMNVEHTWPQSQGAVGVAKSDLHHLFPTDSKANGIRGNFPFGLVTQPTWQGGGSKCDGKRFEVRPVHRGNVARAKFYFAVRYQKKIDSSEEQVLRKWHQEDPVDAGEKDRNDRIENTQHNRNPFIDRPEFVERIQDF
jgi:hypothetical protein